MGSAVSDVVAERNRQVKEEGFTTAHDDRYVNNDLVLAANNYLGGIIFRRKGLDPNVQRDYGGVFTGWWKWPWSPSWWKPTADRRDLVKAAALILAEIERLDRKG